MEVFIVWSINPSNPDQAFADVTIIAMGGDGNYDYYRDDILQPDNTFRYVWHSCSPNPVSFRVDSGDGQSVRVERGEFAPCP